MDFCEGVKQFQVDGLQRADDTYNEDISGVCFSVKFFLHIEWIDMQAQQRLLEENLKISVMFL